MAAQSTSSGGVVALPPPCKEELAFRHYNEAQESEELSGVERTYRENHAKQTLAYVLGKKEEYSPLQKRKMTVLEAFKLLDTIADESDPDLHLSQLQHAMQTAEGLRKSGLGREWVLTGLLHDIGKVLYCWGEPQWSVVGDTFPVGCSFSSKIVHSKWFRENPDIQDSQLNTANGIYSPNCGLDSVHFSYGHDEYGYEVFKNYLPEECVYAIRYHSAYCIHREREYAYLQSEKDVEWMEKYVRMFNHYDLYTKDDENVYTPETVEDQMRTYYYDLIDEYTPGSLSW